MLELRIGPALDDAAAYLYFCIGIVEVEDGKRDAGIALCVFTLERSRLGADQDKFAFACDPDRGVVRRAIGH